MKIIGHIVCIDIPEHSGNYHIDDNGNLANNNTLIDVKGCLKNNFKVIGTTLEIITNSTSELIDHILVNHYIDYMDLSKEFVNPLQSFASWRQFYGVSDNSLFLTYADTNSTYKSLKTLPKTAILEPECLTFLEIIDNDKQKFVVNKYGVPINFNGYHKYDLNNFRIKSGIYYALKSDDNYIIQNTSVDINIDNINPGNMRKERLYNNLINNDIVLLQ
jgi:hypothetical protein